MENINSAEESKKRARPMEPKFRKKSSYLLFSALFMMGLDHAQATTCSSTNISSRTSGKFLAACTNDSAGEDITSPQGTRLTVSGHNGGTAAGIVVSAKNGNAGIITNAGNINGRSYARGIEIYQGQSAQGIINTGNINVAGHGIELGYQDDSTNSRDGHLTGVDNATLPDGSTYNGKLAIYNSGTISATDASGNTNGSDWGDESGIRVAGFEPDGDTAYSTIDGDIVNDSDGTITGSGYGINIANSTAKINGNIVNKGTIQATNHSGIRNLGTINGAIQNLNSIISDNGEGIYNAGTISGDITNSQDATITADTDGIANIGSIANIINAGTIKGGDKKDGIYNSGTISGNIINEQGATIIGGVDGIGNDGSIANIINSGKIDGGPLRDGIYNKGTISGDITNNSGATINGDIDGIGNIGSIANIINYGTINGGADNSGIYNKGTISGAIINSSGATIQAGLDGIGNTGTVANIKNNGTIKGGTGGSGIYNKGTVSGDITNGRDAIISNTTKDANGITNNGSVANIINKGTIEGGPNTGSGINNAGTVSGDITNSSDATIRSDNSGITNKGSIANIKNSGSITGTNGSAIENIKTISGVIDNAGTLQGQIAAITNRSSGTISSINNSGDISVTGKNSAGISNIGTISSNITNNNGGTITGGSEGDAIYNIGTISGDITNNSGATLKGGADGIGNLGSVTNIINSGTIIGGDNNDGIYNAGTISGDIINNQGATIIGGVDGIGNDGSIANIINSGKIEGGPLRDGIYNKGTISGDITNNSGATINGDIDGIGNIGSIANIINHGTINGGPNNDGIYNKGTISGAIVNSSDATIQAGLDGIGNTGTVTNIQNNGTIKGGTGGSGIYNKGKIVGDITNGHGATISNTTSTANGITNIGSVTNITNDGTIEGGGDSGSGINNTGTIAGNIVNGSDAIIRSDNNGISNKGSITNIKNSGSITGTNGSAIVNDKAINGVIDNAGTLQGQIAGITNSSEGNIATITNSGTIVGTGDNGIGIANNGTIGKITNQANGTVSGNKIALNNTGTITDGIDNYGTFNGAVQLGGATLSLLGDSAAVNGTITGNDQSAIHVGNADNPTRYTTGYNAQVGTIDVASNSTLQLNNGTTWGASSPAADAIAIKGSYISNGSTTLAGNVTNSGKIYLSGKDSAEPGNVLNVRGNYVGNPGSKLYFNTVLGDDNSPTDKLAIAGDTSGATDVYINNKNGAGAYTNKGIELITVGGNSAGRFVQANRVVGGAYDYYLQRGTKDGENTNNWYLANTKPVEPSATLDQSRQQPKGTPIYRPEAGSYASNIMAANTLFNMTLHDRLGETQYIDPLSGERKVTSMWLRNVGGHQHTQMADGQNRTQANRYVVQMGGDLAQWSSDDLDRYHLGAMVGYGNQHSTTHNRLSHYDSKGIIHGYSTGLYGTWYQNEQDKTGMYVDSWALYNWFDNEVKGDRISAESYKSKGVTASVESGYSYKFGGRTMPGGTVNSYWVQPQVQATWMGVKADSHHEDNGTKVHSTGNDNLQTRLGVRGYISSVAPGGLEFQPFLEANWVYTRKSFGTTMNGTGDSIRGARNAALLKQGVEMKLDKNFHTWANVAETLGHNGYNDIQGMVGLKYAF